VDNDGTPQRARDILRYYVGHPGMTDTLEGIAGWRLVDEIVRQYVGEVERAVQWLVARGYLEQRTSAASPPLYRLNPGMRDAAEQLVADCASPVEWKGSKES
jgi:hypothetical protein